MLALPRSTVQQECSEHRRAAEQVGAARDPGDRLDVDRVQRKECRPDSRGALADPFVPRQAPDEQGADEVQQHVRRMESRRLKPPEQVVRGIRQADERAVELTETVVPVACVPEPLADEPSCRSGVLDERIVDDQRPVVPDEFAAERGRIGQEDDQRQAGGDPKRDASARPQVGREGTDHRRCGLLNPRDGQA